ncbi:MAG: hypothetical protein Q8P73_02365 [bacterium]|nr:hypothetical protein [bacterium]
MSRRLIIILLIVLIVAVLGGTVLLVVQRLRGPSDTTTTAPTTPGSGTGLTPADTGTQQLVNPGGDDDNDGLSNADEVLWGTDPSNPDTDGDGFYDGEEVAANHNPTIAGPDDALPENFSPGQNLQPLNAAPLQVDQYFVDNLDLSGPKEDLTAKYQQQYKEEERTANTLSEFTKAQPIITKLPTPKETTINVAKVDSSYVLATYLGVANGIYDITDTKLFDNAISNLMKGDVSSVRGLAMSVRLYQDSLTKTTVPPVALPVHKLLLGYTELLAATYDQMALFNEDPMKAILAIRQLGEVNDQYYPLIRQELERLQGG